MAFYMKHSPVSQVGGVSPLNQRGKGCAKSEGGDGCVQNVNGQWLIWNNKHGGVFRKCSSKADCDSILRVPGVHKG